MPCAYLREHHANITNLHIKDRKKNQGDNTPWGTGDTPIRRGPAAAEEGALADSRLHRVRAQRHSGCRRRGEDVLRFTPATLWPEAGTSSAADRPDQTLAADVPPVFRLGGMVGDDGNLARPDARLLWRADRARRGHDGAGGDDLPVLRRHDCGSFPRHRKDPCGTAPDRRRDPVLWLDDERVWPVLRGAAGVRPVLHADAGAQQLASPSIR